MPHIDHAINRGPLRGSERWVMDVIENHPEHIWSTSDVDLAELAIWTRDPAVQNPEHLLPATPMDKDTVIEFTSWQYADPVMLKTYKLSKIRWALSRLANKQLIAAFILHNRRYYGSYAAFAKVERRLAAMNQADLDRAGFSPGTTVEPDAGDELGDDAAFDPIGKP